MATVFKEGKSAEDRFEADQKVQEIVRAILADIRDRGDEAVRELSHKFDNWNPENFKLSDDQIEEITSSLPRQTIDDLKIWPKLKFANSPRCNEQPFGMSRSKHFRVSSWGTRTSRSTRSVVMCRVGDIP